MLRLLFVLGVAIVITSSGASAQSRPPADGLALDAPSQTALEIVNRVPYLSNQVIEHCIALHAGDLRSHSRAYGVKQTIMRWTFEPLPDAGGSVKYIGPGPTYPAPEMLKHPVLIRVEIVVGKTTAMHQEAVALASSEPPGPRFGSVIFRLSHSVLTQNADDVVSR
jgi:hypothetical protein